jgi:hypothetical protein
MSFFHFLSIIKLYFTRSEKRTYMNEALKEPVLFEEELSVVQKIRNTPLF